MESDKIPILKYVTAIVPHFVLSNSVSLNVAR
jgi:hypothetical protein